MQKSETTAWRGDTDLQSATAQPLAIIGIGCLFPRAAGPGFFWANVKHGTDCIGDVPQTHWNPDDYFDADPKTPDMTYARRGGFLSAVEFNPREFGIAPRDIEATDTTQLLGLVAAKQALTDAGVELANPDQQVGGGKVVDRDRVSVILGVTGTLELVIPLGARLGHPKWKRAMRAAGIPEEQVEDAAARIAESYVPWQENSFPGLLGNVVAGRIANKLDLGGTNCVVDAACASSLSAVHLAALELQAGRCDVAVTGGCDTFNDIFMYMCFSKTPALSPTGDAKPFDTDGDGTILGEGLGVVVLKRLADAERAGDTIYAVLRGVGSSSDGKGKAIYEPSASGQKKALLAAYKQAGVTPDTIELVEAHGTGTKVGDTVEVTALTEVYSGQPAVSSTAESRTDSQLPTARPWCAIGSVKSQIGHTKAAAGAASLIKAALALYNKVLPPTIKVRNPVEPLRAPDSPFYVNAEMRPWLPRSAHPRRAALSAFGFGGSNFHAVLEEHELQKRDPDWDGSVEIVALSASSPDSLANELTGLPREWDAFALAAAASRRNFDPGANYRLCFAAHREQTDLQKLISTAAARLAAEPGAANWYIPGGACYGSGPAGKLAVLFPGQGSQYVGMMRQLACLFPEMLSTLATANQAVADLSQDNTDSRRLSDRIYPPTSFDETRIKEYNLDLRDTRNAQPAIGAVSFGAWRVLHERFGLRVDAFAGHSYGELAALAAAGRMNERDLFSISRVRGQLMATNRGGDPGAMLAVFADAGEVESIVASEKIGVVIANRNSPKQTVLSGPSRQIDRAIEVLARAKCKTARLPVAAAFHSELVADVALPFRAALDGISFLPANGVVVYSNTTASVYPTSDGAAKDLLAQQLAKPVAFVEQIRAMAAAGIRVFVEVGPGSVLTRLVEDVLGGESGISCFALDASSGKRSSVFELGNVLARLAASGFAVRLSEWEKGSRCRPAIPKSNQKPELTINVCGANIVAPRQPRPPRQPIEPGVSSNQVPRPFTNDSSSTLPETKGFVMPDSGNQPSLTDPGALAQALAMTQQSLSALQRMQEQTAALHKQFLDAQESSHRMMHTLVEQQQALLLTGLGAAVATPTTIAMPSHAPVPVVSPPPMPIPAPQAAFPIPAQPAPVSRVQPAAPTPQPPRSVPANRIASTLLAVVSEKTGYPVESLDLSLSLDSDLGVDSIKRVEILSALQEKLPEAPQVKPEHLGTLHTLRDVADFLAGSAVGSEYQPETDEAEILLSAIPASNGEYSGSRNGTVDKAEIASTLLAVVSEKTGYPVESLDLSLSLDSDLGVDSIKRVEILSALQEKLPEAPQVKPEHLGTLHTLRDVADFLAGAIALESAPATTKIPMLEVEQNRFTRVNTPQMDAEVDLRDTMNATNGPASAKTEPAARKPGRHEFEPASRIAAAAGLKSGTSRESIARSLSERVDRSIVQAADLEIGISQQRLSFAPGAEFLIVAENDPLANAIVERLTKSGLKAQRGEWAGASSTVLPRNLAGLILIAPENPETASKLNRQAFDWLKLAASKLRQSGRAAAAVFATVARLDGAFGLADLSPDANPVSGGLAGIVKTARHEWPEVSCRALDVAASLRDPTASAAAIVDEALSAGPGEVGIAATHRCTLELARTVRPSNSQNINLGVNDVILVTGGARGVTAEAAVALAETYGATLILTGRTPAPTPEPHYLANLTGEAELKKAISDALGAESTPRTVGDLYKKVQAQREVRRTLERIEKAGAKAEYYPVDITNARAVAAMMRQIEAGHGAVTALIHGAGVLADKRIEDLTGEQFDHVYSTKVTGLQTLLEHVSRTELKALVLFSSTTARLGRTGQLAYACANEVLNKIAQVESRRRPECRVVAINWGPWDGGMVTPALRKMFEAEGVGVIPLSDGATFLIQELNASGRSAEVVALARPQYRQPSSADVTRSAAGSSQQPTQTPPAPVMSPPNPLPSVEMAVAFERIVDVATHPILKSHVIDGLAVLPLALHLEWLAHAALHGNPGLQFHGFNDLRVTSGIKVEADARVSLRALAGKAVKQNKLFLVPVELSGKRRDGREVIYSRGEIVLAASLPKPPPADSAPHVSPLGYEVEHAYSELLFHGPDLHGIAEIVGRAGRMFIGSAYPAPSPSEWFEFPLRSGWVADPLVLDAAFQMMILWTQEEHHTGSLPSFIGRYRQFRKSYPADPITVIIRVTRDDAKFARADIDFIAPDGEVIAQMQNYECVMEPALNAAFRRNQLALK